MVAHHGISAEINPEQRGQYTNPIFDPGSTVLIASAAVGIITTEEGSTNAAGGDVIVGCLG
jgi:hypothetical protein